MTRMLTAIAILIAALCVTPVALAGPNTPGAASHPHVSIRPNILRPSIHPRIQVPSIGRYVARKIRKTPRHGLKRPANGRGIGDFAKLPLPPQAAPLTDDERADLKLFTCNTAGGGASTNPDGSSSCVDPQGNDVFD